MKPIDSKHNSPLNFNSISLELRLLLSCLRASVGQDERDRINTLTRMAIDWDVFIGLVDRHRTPSQAYRSLNRFAANNIPEPVLNRLRERFQRNAQQVLAKTAELVRIVKLFEQNHIRILPIKGPVVALQAYGDLGSRHVGDLDIMVSPESVKMAEDVLVQQGYKRIHPDFDLTQKQHAAYLSLTVRMVLPAEGSRPGRLPGSTVHDKPSRPGRAVRDGRCHYRANYHGNAGFKKSGCLFRRAGGSRSAGEGYWYRQERSGGEPLSCYHSHRPGLRRSQAFTRRQPPLIHHGILCTGVRENGPNSDTFLERNQEKRICLPFSFSRSVRHCLGLCGDA